jgi:hypothetical protein
VPAARCTGHSGPQRDGRSHWVPFRPGAAPASGGVQSKARYGIYTTILLTRKLEIPFRIIGRNVKDTLEHILSKIVEGKCMAEGFIRPGSVKILTYSNGYLYGKNAIFEDNP